MSTYCLFEVQTCLQFLSLFDSWHLFWIIIASKVPSTYFFSVCFFSFSLLCLLGSMYLSFSVYLSISIFLCLSINVYLSIFLYLSFYVYLSMSIFLCLSFYIDLSMSIYQCLSIFLYLSFYFYLSMSVYLSISIFLCLHIFLWLFIFSWQPFHLFFVVFYGAKLVFNFFSLAKTSLKFKVTLFKRARFCFCLSLKMILGKNC